MAAVALRLGKSLSTFEKELRGAHGFKLGADDAVEVAAICRYQNSEHALDFPNAVAGAVGGMLVLLPSDHMDSLPCTALDVAALMRECADVVSVAVGADTDSDISASELRRIEAQWADVVLAGQRLVQHMRARHEAGKPAHLRAAAHLKTEGVL